MTTSDPKHSHVASVRKGVAEGHDQKPGVDRNTAKGLGEGGHSPHPQTAEEPAPFDPHSYKPPSDAGDANEPEQNDRPIPSQRKGHRDSQGGLPEEQPVKK